MHKVLVERERRGSGERSKKHGGRVSEDYDGPTFESSARRRQYGWHCKDLSDNIGPVKRYLRSQVGRPWNKIYSEIKKAVPPGMHGDHIWGHIKGIVQTDVIMGADGEWYFGGSWMRYPRKIAGLYVSPRTGILCYRTEKSWRTTARERLKREAAAREEIRISENEHLKKINGCWFREVYGWKKNEVTGDSYLALILKKQLNKKELRLIPAA